MFAKSDIKKFGENVVADMLKQYRQIYKGSMEGNPVVISIDPYILSFKEKIKAQEEVNLMK